MKTIVLVEDDKAISDAIKLALDPAGYSIVPYVDGQEILRNEMMAPDLFILDKNIAGVDGLDICRFIKSNDRYKHIPVVVLSASPDIVHMARDAGADDAIAKPFSLTILRLVVKKHTDKG